MTGNRVWVDPRYADHPLVLAAVRAAKPDAQIMGGRLPGKPFPAELTPAGEQYVIPGCETRANRQGSAPVQGTLWK